jgi:hypothetical protein
MASAAPFAERASVDTPAVQIRTCLCRHSNRSLFAHRNSAGKTFREARDWAGNSNSQTSDYEGYQMSSFSRIADLFASKLVSAGPTFLFRRVAVSHQLEPDERIGVGSPIAAPSPDRLAIARFALPGRPVARTPRSRRPVVVTRVCAPAGNVRGSSEARRQGCDGQRCKSPNDDDPHVLPPWLGAHC